MSYQKNVNRDEVNKKTRALEEKLRQINKPWYQSRQKEIRIIQEALKRKARGDKREISEIKEDIRFELERKECFDTPQNVELTEIGVC